MQTTKSKSEAGAQHVALDVAHGLRARGAPRVQAALVLKGAQDVGILASSLDQERSLDGFVFL